MTRLRTLLVLLLALAVPAASAAVPQLSPSFGNLPLAFEPNEGQTDPEVRFLARGPGYTLFATDDGAVVRLARAAPTDELDGGRSDAAAPAVLRMRFEGAQAPSAATALDPLPGVSHYYVGNDPAKWRTDVPQYRRARLTGVYPGIDVVYYGTNGQLEYDFVIAPGADPRSIVMSFDGARRVALAETGDLRLELAEATLTLRRPLAYQEVAGARREVSSRYRLDDGGRVGFELGPHDPTLPLVVDPVLVYSSFFGGIDGDEVVGVGADSVGNLFLAGRTQSVDFPRPGDTFAGINATFVAKISAAGNTLLYSTLIDGRGLDSATGFAVLPGGSAFVAGETQSDDFPTTALAFQRELDPGFPFPFGVDGSDAFVVRLSPQGALSYSTYLGGERVDLAQAVAVDTAGRAYVGGFSFSHGFPLRGELDGNVGVAFSDAFLSVLSADGRSLVYSTFLGGGDIEEVLGVAVDSAGNAYVVGETESTDFPVKSACNVCPLFQSTNQGGQDGFLTKINPAATGPASLVYSTYVGGGGTDSAHAVALDASGFAYVVGTTGSTTFPLQAPPGGAIPDSLNAGVDAFLAKLDPNASTLVFSTFLGGSSSESGLDVAVDGAGNAYLVGQTTSTNLPRRLPLDATLGGPSDGYMAKIDTLTGRLLWSTYFGGADDDVATGVALDPGGNVYLGGTTFSGGTFPRKSAVQPTFGGSPSDGFVAKIATTSADTIGVFRPSEGKFFLRNSNVAGSPDFTVNLGQSGDRGVAGDWNGTGSAKPGIQSPNGIVLTWSVRPCSNATPITFFCNNITFNFGVVADGDLPFAGDWDGDGDDTAGIFRSGSVFLTNGTTGAVDITFSFGAAGDLPIAGDWDGDGDDSIGVFRPATGEFFLRFTNDTGGADVTFAFGLPGDLPVAGDWDGDGVDTIGVFRAGTFLLRNSNTAGPADLAVVFGAEGDQPVVGDWDGRP